MTDCIVKTFKHDGPIGLYRGFVVSIQGIIVYRACYFGMFDTIKVFIQNPEQTPFIISFAIAEVNN